MQASIRVLCNYEYSRRIGGTAGLRGCDNMNKQVVVLKNKLLYNLLVYHYFYKIVIYESW